ncbi:hypothetical protein BX666DRAFT_1959672 [Dichotomocladium elegans]|nr:hypothetical protein BX666DRAFT_1959672 [Dichotomocladium elegans]
MHFETRGTAPANQPLGPSPYERSSFGQSPTQPAGWSSYHHPATWLPDQSERQSQMPQQSSRQETSAIARIGDQQQNELVQVNPSADRTQSEGDMTSARNPNAGTTGVEQQQTTTRPNEVRTQDAAAGKADRRTSLQDYLSGMMDARRGSIKVKYLPLPILFFFSSTPLPINTHNINLKPLSFLLDWVMMVNRRVLARWCILERCRKVAMTCSPLGKKKSRRTILSAQLKATLPCK